MQQHQVHQVINDATSVKDQFPSLFQEELGKLEEFKAHVDHGNTDCMSRFLAPGLFEESPVPADVVLTLEHLDTTPITSAMVREWTRKDPGSPGGVTSGRRLARHHENRTVAGPFLGHMFLMLVDAHSKWMDIYTMSSITAEATIGNLKASFSTHGLPDVLVTDNGPSFKS